MKIKLHAPFWTAFVCSCFIVLTPASGFAQSKSEPDVARRQDDAQRADAKRTYNNTLKRLFAELEQARTADELQSARSRAMEGFKRALHQDPSYSLPHYNLGVLAEAGGDRAVAIEHFEKFKKLSDKPDLSQKAEQRLAYLRSSGALNNGSAGRKTGEYEDTLRKVNALINLGLLKEAVSLAARAAELAPTRWESYALIGAALLDRRQFGDALGLLQQASLRAPADVRAKLSAAIKVCEANIKR
jgi:tetratricopeptide (TPR) repeat protein